MPEKTKGFDATAGLPGGWRVVAHVPGARLSLARAGTVQFRELGRQAFVTLTAVLLIIVIWAATHSDTGFRVVIYPVLGLLAVVAALGVLSMVRAASRAASGVHLGIDAEAKVATGLVRGGGFFLGPVSAVSRVKVVLRRGAGTDPKQPRAWAQLEVTLDDGRVLEAPDAWGPDEEWERTRALVEPVAREIAALVGKAVEREG